MIPTRIQLGDQNVKRETFLQIHESSNQKALLDKSHQPSKQHYITFINNSH